jgi:hypothetical protein
MAIDKTTIEKIKKFLDDIQKPSVREQYKLDFYQRFYIANVLFGDYELTDQRKQEINLIIEDAAKKNHSIKDNMELNEMINLFTFYDARSASINDAIMEVNKYILQQILSNEPGKIRAKEKLFKEKNEQYAEKIQILKNAVNDLEKELTPKESAMQQLDSELTKLEKISVEYHKTKAHYDDLITKKQKYDELKAFVTNSKTIAMIKELEETVSIDQYNNFLDKIKTIKLLQEALIDNRGEAKKDFVSGFSELAQANPILMGMLPSLSGETKIAVENIHEKSQNLLKELHVLIKRIILQ